MNQPKKTRHTGAGRKPHPLKGSAITTTLRIYPIDRAYLEFKHGTLTQAIASICSGHEYNTYLMQQVENLTK